MITPGGDTNRDERAGKGQDADANREGDSSPDIVSGMRHCIYPDGDNRSRNASYR